MWTLHQLPLLAAILAALFRSHDTKLKLYLLAEFLSSAAIEAAYVYYHGIDATGYTVIYAILTPLPLAAALNIGRPRWVSMLITVSLAIAVVTSLTEFPANSIIALVEGMVYMLSGISLAFTVSEGKVSLGIYGTLAALWMVLAVFDCGYAMGWQLPAWHKLNEWWPAATCIVAYSVVAIYGGRDDTSCTS